jgi:5-methylcytosine-specific restriction endonuclease McrA
MAEGSQERFYHSALWKKCRRAYIAERVSIDGGLCMSCGKRIGSIVHHIEHLNELNVSDLDISLEPNNLSYLCVPCHNRIHEKKRNELIQFDEEGQPYIYKPQRVQI